MITENKKNQEVPSGRTQDINTAKNILNKVNKKMGGGMMKRPMGYKEKNGESMDTGRIGHRIKK